MRNALARYYVKYFDNYHDRTLAISLGSFAVNALIGMIKLIAGVVLFSPWFMITGIYYLMLCSARGQVLKRYQKTREIEDQEQQYEKQLIIHRYSGIFICLLGASYFGVCLRMYSVGDVNTFPYYIVYGIAAVAFYKISTAIYGIIKTHRLHNPILSTLKTINFVDACVSIVAVQCALIVLGGGTAGTATASSALFGMACSVMFLVIGILMFCRKKSGPREDAIALAEAAKPPKPPKTAFLNRLRKPGLRLTTAEIAAATQQIAAQFFTELKEQDPDCRCVCAVTYRKRAFQISGRIESSTPIDCLACAQRALARLAIRPGVTVACDVQQAPFVKQLPAAASLAARQ